MRLCTWICVGAASLALALTGCDTIKEKYEQLTGGEKKAEEPTKAEADKKAAEEAAAKLEAEKKAAEEAQKKAEAEKLEAEKKQVSEGLNALSKTYTETSAALRAHQDAWQKDGTNEKIQAVATFLGEYGRLEAELNGVRAYLLQDDVDKARLGLETLKGKCDALDKQAAVLLADKPQPMDPTLRARVLDLLAEDACLQKAIGAGTLTEADLGAKRAQLLAAAGMSADEYLKLRDKVTSAPQPTDATVLEALAQKKCPDAPAVGAAPAEGAVPAAGTVPAEATPPAEGTVPAEGTAEVAPAEGTAEVAPAEVAGEVKTEEGATPPAEGIVGPTHIGGDSGTPGPAGTGTPAAGTGTITIKTNQDFTGAVGRNKAHKVTLKVEKRGSKIGGMAWFAGGKFNLNGSWSAKGHATFSGKSGKDHISCSGQMKGSLLQGTCNGRCGGNDAGGPFALKIQK